MVDINKLFEWCAGAKFMSEELNKNIESYNEECVMLNELIRDTEKAKTDLETCVALRNDLESAREQARALRKELNVRFFELSELREKYGFV